MSRRRRRPGLLGILVRAGAAVALGTAVADSRVERMDERARRAVLARRNGDLDQAMPILTDLGSVYALGGAAVVLAAGGERRLARHVAVAGGLAWTAAQALKPLYQRARPYEGGLADRLVRTPAGTSYPSGHPAVTAAITSVLRDEVRTPAKQLLEEAPKLVAFSRVYTGVHHPTDVIGGLLLGRAVGDLVRRRMLRSR